MVEMVMTYDFLPGVNMESYAVWAKKAIGSVLEASGLVEFRANRNILGSPQIRTTTLWKTAADWANFSESTRWQKLEAEMRSYVTNLHMDLWGPSPIVPEPLRPK